MAMKKAAKKPAAKKAAAKKRPAAKKAAAKKRPAAKKAAAKKRPAAKKVGRRLGNHLFADGGPPAKDNRMGKNVPLRVRHTHNGGIIALARPDMDMWCIIRKWYGQA